MSPATPSPLATRLPLPTRRPAAPALLLAAVAAFIVLAAATAGARAAEGKNAGDPAPPSAADMPAGSVPPSLPLPRDYLSCATNGSFTFTTSASEPQTVISCSLLAPTGGVLLAAASGSLANSTGAYEARAALVVDQTGYDGSNDRWVDIADDAGDGTDKSIATALYQPVAAGAHTIRFLASRMSGTGQVQMFDPALNVIFVPAPLAQTTTCGTTASQTFQTTSEDLTEVTSCELTVPAGSIAFVTGSASAGYLDGAYELRARVGTDVIGTAGSDRWVNVYPNAGDGVDETVHTQQSFALAAGTHRFYLSVERFSGSGTVLLYDPSLTVLVVPQASAALCAAQSSTSYRNDSTLFTAMRTCAMYLPQPARALVYGSTAFGLDSIGTGDPYEVQARIGIDAADGSDRTDRWLNVDLDSGDGTDRCLVDHHAVDLDAGVHTVSLVARRYSGPGALNAFSPTLHVLLLAPDRIFAASFEGP